VGPYCGPVLININDYYPNFEIITCNDPYLGAHPFITVPTSFQKAHKECNSGTFCLNELLKDPEVIAYMKAKDPNPNVIFVMINNETEELCKQNGLTIWGASVETFN
jgi:hypothetical protein